MEGEPVQQGGRGRGRGRGRARAAVPGPAQPQGQTQQPGQTTYQPPQGQPQYQGQANYQPQGQPQYQGQAAYQPQGQPQHQGQATYQPQGQPQHQGQATYQPQPEDFPPMAIKPAPQQPIRPNGGRGRGRQPPPGQPGEQAAAGAGNGRGIGGSGPPGSVQQVAGGIARLQMGDRAGGDRPGSDRPGGDRPERGRRGGLQRRVKYAIIEADVQPANVQVKTGSHGHRIPLQTNFATFINLPNTEYHIFEVLFNWALPFKGKMDQIKQLQKSGYLKAGPFAFDGVRIYSTVNWTEEMNPLLLQLPGGEKTVSLNKVSSGVPGSEQYYQLVNIIFNNAQVLMGQERVGRGYFAFPKEQQHHGAGAPSVEAFQELKLHSGYTVALQRGFIANQPTTIMHIDRAHRILNEETAFIFLQNNKKTDLLGRQVMTKYNNRTYTVNDIREDVDIVNTTFEIEQNGQPRQVSYVDYFRERYNITLQNRIQTFIISRLKKRNVQKQRKDRLEGAPKADASVELCLPSELCYLCGLSEIQKRNYQRNRQFNTLTKRNPNQRSRDVADFQAWLSSNNACVKFLQDWNIRFDHQSLTVSGRLLNPISVNLYKPGAPNNVLGLQNHGGQWDVKQVQFPVQRKDYKLGILIFQKMNAATFTGNLFDVSKSMLLEFIHDERNDRREVVPRGRLGDSLCHFALGGKYDILLCMGIRDNDYGLIKSCTIESGLLTQCITKRNSEDRVKGKSIATKVAIQMGCKLGLDAWRTNFKLDDYKTMVVGMDTYHSKSQGRTVQAAVFSRNPSFTQYISVAAVGKSREEFNERIKVFFRQALDIFYAKTKFLPDRIVVYRDGVGDSQLEFLKSVEVEEMKSFLTDYYYQGHQRDMPHLVVIVVKKRINARFFNNGQNPNPGTVVDTGVVKPNFYEFFLVSQRTNQGTVTPTNYNIVEDTLVGTSSAMSLTPDKLQYLSFSLTHLYYNWPGTIRVPAPVHYAHKLAYLIGQYVPNYKSDAMNRQIQEKLYYL